MRIHDYVIVGAGTSGAVLAARLSEDPSAQVLLLEAGPDYPDEQAMPEALRDAYLISGVHTHDWGIEAQLPGGRTGALIRGKVVGGSSQVNGAGALRAPAADYDAWAARGLPGWSYQEVLPAFRRLESDQQFGEQDHHGTDGPIPITRWGINELSPLQRGFLDSMLAAGHPYCDDLNSAAPSGVGLYPQNRRGRLRVSTNLAYLGPARARENLTIRSCANVERVVLDGGKAIGVQVDGELVRAREVILSAGAPMSPTILMRSGIGTAAQLLEAGVQPLVDLPGVGRELLDQPGAILPFVPQGGAAVDGPTLQLVSRLDAFPGFEADGGFYLCLFDGVDLQGAPDMARAIGAPAASFLMVGDMRSASRGSVSLASADPTAPPVVDLGFYTRGDDLDRMMAGYRHAWEIAQHSALSSRIDRVALADEATIADDGRLRSLLFAITSTRLNVTGGCAMGTAVDPVAVVDERCRVFGVDGLRVVDASIVPLPLGTAAALSCMMLGERAAELVAADR